MLAPLGKILLSVAALSLLCSPDLTFGQVEPANDQEGLAVAAPAARTDSAPTAGEIALRDGAMDIRHAAADGSDPDPDDYLKFYFPDAPSFDPAIPRPDQALGFAPGDLHIMPETLFAYVKAAADASSRLHLEVVGQSNEWRPLTSLYISSPENIANLEQIRQRHLQAGSPSDDILVVKLAYSVHGNEPSGANAVPLIAYYLAASSDPWVTSFLSRTVVIITPVQNPDGLTRFAQWANTHRSEIVNADPENRNHHSSWPSGRTNHYLFNLNRDWIFGIQPESQATIREYHRWKPHVLGDYHEMGGSKPTYFFQPGHPKRTNPLTLPENLRITRELARFHARALDAAGQDYYTQERFDDYYYGKGSAYPDINGGIGLLFEQTAVRGMERDFGGERVSFRQSIANQVVTSFSLMRGSDAMRSQIIDYRFAFRDAEAQRAKNSKAKAFVISDDGDPQRAFALLDMLKAHEIKIYELAKPVSRGQQEFRPGSAWVVPASADSYGMVTSLFELRTSFEDSGFSDVSTWNLPLAFNLPYASLPSTNGLLGREISSRRPRPASGSVDKDAVAYAIDWNQFEAPRFLQILLENGELARVAGQPFTAELLAGGSRHFNRGTLVLRMHDSKAHDSLTRALQAVPSIRVNALSSGLAGEGPDIGSREMGVVRPVKVALVVGDGVDTEEAGEVIYAFDKQVGMPLTLIDAERVKSADLSKYTHILMVDGGYSRLDGAVDALRGWVKGGGTIVTQKRAAEWAHRKIVAGPKVENGARSNDDSKRPNDKDAEEYRAYRDYEADRDDRLITGAIFNMNIDLTHPYAFGYSRAATPVFRTWNKVIERSESAYDTPLRYTSDPLISGFASDEKVAEIKGTPALAVHRVSKGYVVALADNLNFRGFWRGTSRIYLNTIFFTQVLGGSNEED